MMSEPFAIIVFDGECAFCSGSVKWIIKHDRRAGFRFTPRQSPAGQQVLARYGLPPGGVESMVLVEGSRVSTHSTAVFRIASKLPWPWRGAGVLLLVPRPIRDVFYRQVAKRRKKISGKRLACSVPTPEERQRILYEVSA